MHVRFEFFSKQICNVEALICYFDKNIKTLTQIHFPRDAHIFRTCTIFYRHYKGFSVVRPYCRICASLPFFLFCFVLFCFFLFCLFVFSSRFPMLVLNFGILLLLSVRLLFFCFLHYSYFNIIYFRHSLILLYVSS